MNESNELSDIVLNKNSSSNSNKKIILAVATLGVVLIIVVMIMNTLSSSGTDNLPQAVLPPEPQQQTYASEQTQEEPLFEDVEVINDDTLSSSDEDLDAIAQKLKAQSAATQQIKSKEVQKKKKETATVKKVSHIKKDVVKTTAHTVTKTTKKQKILTNGRYYIQVGSFAKYKPNKHFLHKITQLGYHYKYHKVNKINKVLVGPFATKKEANRAKKVLRAKVEPGSFLIKL